MKPIKSQKRGNEKTGKPNQSLQKTKYSHKSFTITVSQKSDLHSIYKSPKRKDPVLENALFSEENLALSKIIISFLPDGPKQKKSSCFPIRAWKKLQLRRKSLALFRWENSSVRKKSSPLPPNRRAVNYDVIQLFFLLQKGHVL